MNWVRPKARRFNLFAEASYPCDVGGDRLSAGGRLRKEQMTHEAFDLDLIS